MSPGYWRARWARSMRIWAWEAAKNAAFCVVCLLVLLVHANDGLTRVVFTVLAVAFGVLGVVSLGMVGWVAYYWLESVRDGR